MRVKWAGPNRTRTKSLTHDRPIIFAGRVGSAGQANFCHSCWYPNPSQLGFGPEFWRETHFPVPSRHKKQPLLQGTQYPNFSDLFPFSQLFTWKVLNDYSDGAEKMDAFGGFFVDEKAVRVENIFLEFLKRYSLSTSLSLSIVCIW